MLMPSGREGGSTSVSQTPRRPPRLVAGSLAWDNIVTPDFEAGHIPSRGGGCGEW
jgi:hypothetical protein